MADSRRLQQLVDGQLYDELLREVSVADIAETWVRYAHNDSRVDPAYEDPDWWAVELWMDTAGSSPWRGEETRVRAGILAIVAAAADADVGFIGAAIMEVFITADEDRLVWVEEQAAASDRFRRSLANVYIWEHGEEVLRRVERIAGVPLPDPSRPRSE